MPRSARIDAPGVLHHVMIRGIERKKIFFDNNDRDDFLTRLSVLLPVTGNMCYAWTLMPNHGHFLIQSGNQGIAALMRRLLTGYAVSFNRRHKRHGQLFQNRYKSIICQEDSYLLELVRYIHLNPLRAKIVSSLDQLGDFPYCGHAALLENINVPWQNCDYVLRYFGKRKKDARKEYLSFVELAHDQGRRPELTGGGIIRSLGGWSEVKQLRAEGQDRIKGDQRILGDSDFVEQILSLADEQYTHTQELANLGYDFDRVVERVASLCNILPSDIFSKGRQKPRTEARGLLCFWAVRELGLSLKEVSERLGISSPGVGYSVQRGEKIAAERGLHLLEESF